MCFVVYSVWSQKNLYKHHQRVQEKKKKNKYFLAITQVMMARVAMVLCISTARKWFIL